MLRCLILCFCFDLESFGIVGCNLEFGMMGCLILCIIIIWDCGVFGGLQFEMLGCLVVVFL